VINYTRERNWQYANKTKTNCQSCANTGRTHTEETKKHKTMDEKEQILEILAEANAYGLRNEVEQTAWKIINEGSTTTLVEAYEMAFNEWVK
jgi:hypothetical protein